MTQTPTLHPVLLSGGAGTRLWPLSRASTPKQLLPLVGEHSMLQETWLRLRGLPELAPPLVICNSEQRFLVAEQLQQLGVQPAALMLEPAARNTAPALAVAALQLAAADPQALMLALPSDHVIADIAAFHAAIAEAISLAQQGFLVAFGIAPTSPETGYGYIQAGEELGGGARRIAHFVEKPDAATARAYLAGGDYSWNSGMFLFRAGDFLSELRRYRPAIEASCATALQQARRDLDFLRLGPAFAECEAVPVDVAVMEPTGQAAVIALDVGWSDIGSWASLWEYLAKDDEGNVRRGEVLTHNVHNCFIAAETRVVAAVGVADLVVVETADAVLVAHKDAAQDVKKVVEQLQAGDRTEHLTHRRVYRPWGSYEAIDRGDRYQVKRITVKPGARLSLQMHHHRSEHWVVVRGTAEVTIGDAVHLISENQSIYVALGTVHRLHNPGKVALDMIEVQSGAYLNEDDIVRLEDVYGREARPDTLP